MDQDKAKNQGSPPTNQKRSLGVDVDHYQAIIDDPGVSEVRKRELIAIIGKVVVQFVDIGFDVHPVQQAQADKQKRHKPINPTEKERQSERCAERIDA